MITRPAQSDTSRGETTPLRLGVLESLFVFGSVIALGVGFFLTLPDVLTAFAVPGGSLAILLAAMVSTSLAVQFPPYARGLEWLGCLGCAITWLNVIFYFARGATTGGSVAGWALGFVAAFGAIGLFSFLVNFLPLWSSGLGEDWARVAGNFTLLHFLPPFLYSAGAAGLMVVGPYRGVHTLLTPLLLGVVILWGLHAGVLVHVYLPRNVRARLYHTLSEEWDAEHVGPLVRGVGKGLLFGVLPLGTLAEVLRGDWALWLGSLGLLGIALGLSWVTAWAGVFREKRPAPAAEQAAQVEIPDLLNDIKFAVVNSLVVTAELTLLVILVILLQG